MTCDFRGLFVVVEGVDRCGKNEQAARLARRLSARGEEVSTYSTPCYDTVSGVLIRAMLEGRATLFSANAALVRSKDAVVLQALQLANRYEVAARVRDDLEAGRTVVCVRWWQSARVYSELDGLDADQAVRVSSFLPRPDVEVLLDVGDDASQFLRSRLDSHQRYEKDPSTVEEAARLYRKIWSSDELAGGIRRISVDARGTPNEVEERMWDAVGRFFAMEELIEDSGARKND